ncbi:MAG: hypothetical protein ABSE82_09235 [Nitrososphaerales archaeon]
MSTTTPEPRSQESTQRIFDSVRQRFLVTGEYLRENASIEFNLDINQHDMKSNFLLLIDELRSSGDTAVLRRADHGYLLHVIRKPRYSQRRSKTPLILLIATLAAILADGFIRAHYYSDPLNPHLSTTVEIAAD